MTDNRMPELFKNPKRKLKSMIDLIAMDTLQVGAEEATNEGMDIKVMPKYLIVTQKRMAKQGVIDLKPFFAKSAKRKFNKQGNWYLYIPIAVNRRSIKKATYNELKNKPLKNGSQFTTVYSKSLYDNSNSFSHAVPNINYTPKTHNVSIRERKWGTGTRREYVAFRTVNAKSPANSWIIGRGKVNEENFSPTMIKNIDRLMKYKMKNL